MNIYIRERFEKEKERWGKKKDGMERKRWRQVCRGRERGEREKVDEKKRKIEGPLGSTSFWKRPLSKNEMEALISNHVKEYVFTNT